MRIILGFICCLLVGSLQAASVSSPPQLLGKVTGSLATVNDGSGNSTCISMSTGTLEFTCNVGINTTSPGVPFQVGDQITPVIVGIPVFASVNGVDTRTTSGTRAGFGATVTAAPTSTSSATFKAITGEVDVSSGTSVDIHGMGGITGDTNYAGTGVLANTTGTSGSTVNSGTGSIGTMNGVFGTSANNGTGVVTTMNGVNAAATSSGAVDISYVSGVTSIGRNFSPNKVTNQYGVSATSSNTSTGTVVNAAGLLASLINSNAGGTISNGYGVSVTAANSGTITQGIGLKISGMGSGGTWTNTPYDIYAQDTGTYNYLEGATGIGVAKPVANSKLDVNGHIHPGNAAPTISSCGSGSLTSGSTDHKGSITSITAATACTITFSSTMTTAPARTFSTSAATAVGISSISTSAVTASMTSLTGSLYYICF